MTSSIVVLPMEFRASSEPTIAFKPGWKAIRSRLRSPSMNLSHHNSTNMVDYPILAVEFYCAEGKEAVKYKNELANV